MKRGILFLAVIVFLIAGCGSAQVKNEVLQDSFEITPGQTVCVQFVSQAGRLRARILPTALGYSDTMIFTFQEMALGGKEFMMLTVMNNATDIMKYDAYVKGSNGEGYRYTSTCPVMGRLEAMETWQERIEKIQIKNFRIMRDKKEGDSLICE